MIKTAQDAYLAGRQAALEKIALSVDDKRDYLRNDLEDKMNTQNYTYSKLFGVLGGIGGLAFGKGKGRLVNSLKGLGLGAGGGLYSDLSRPGVYQGKIDKLNKMPEEDVERRYNSYKNLENLLEAMKATKM